MSRTWSERALGGLVLCVLVLTLGRRASAQSLEGLKVGHWVEVRGERLADDVFLAQDIEALPPEDEEALLGTVTHVAPDGTWLEVLGQRVELTDKVRWRKVDLDGVLGTRVKVEGYYRGPLKFSARVISARSAGRDRILGRVDAVRRSAKGVELEVMRYLVSIAPQTELEHEAPLASYELIPPRGPARSEAFKNASARRERTDEDYLQGTIRLSDTLLFGLRAEYSNKTKRDFDLDGSRARDRIDHNVNVSGALVWAPSQRLYTRLAGKAFVQDRQDERDGHSRDESGRLSEAYVYTSGLFGAPLDLQVGRQNYQDPREWLWDQNLDAARLVWHPGDWKLELAAATTLENGSPREEHTERWIAYLSRGTGKRYWSAYVLDQRTNQDQRDWPFFGGLRFYGDLFPDWTLWGELAAVRGFRDDVDLNGWGFDLGGTWVPPAADKWSLTWGYAFGSGDEDPNDRVDTSFRQTGVQDNNSKFAGVTSFKYYGELLEPELSNMHILTLGVGRRFWKRTSLDLVYHLYRQDKAFDRLRDSNLTKRPNGVSTDLGQELDLIFGRRADSGLDTEIIFSAFEPGAAFDDARRAYYVKFQFRYRF